LGYRGRSDRNLSPEPGTVLAVLGLETRSGHPPSKLSGGERQRVGVARALLGNPALVIADEPTGNLDVAATGELLKLLEQLRQDLGLTLIVATHDSAVAETMDRTVRMSGGRVIAA
ncbi:lipoprotein releasing system, ATP-binding protein, partial [mine drainage metagenome]